MLPITSGRLSCPIKVTLYGSEGIGKTSLASRFPDPLFLDMENGTVHMDVNRIMNPEDWKQMLEFIQMVANDPDVCKTLVIDTADKAEELCIDYVCRKFNQPSIESFGFGKGYTYLAEEFLKLLSALDAVIHSGKHVVVIAHAKMRKFEQPDEMGAYDRWELKLTRQVAPLLKEWCDLLLFCNYKTYVVNDGKSNKAQGGKRVMYASYNPCWDAKNRFDLPDEMALDFQKIAHLFQEKKETDEKPVDMLRSRMNEAGISEEELQQAVASRGKFPADTLISAYPDEFITGWLLKHWSKLGTIVEGSRTTVPSAQTRKE